MQTIAAGRFKDLCLKLLDQVAAARAPIVITKRGKPVAQLVPYVAPGPVRSLAGSILRENRRPVRHRRTLGRRS
jgi:antitoxin (DNA-binding transcriptional repressor) of toxin-antitoxin stability system